MAALQKGAGKTITLPDGTTADITAGDLLIQRTEKDGMAVATGDGVTVALETALTPELESEGFAREFVSKLQNIRKEMDLDVADRIQVICDAPEAAVASLKAYTGYICEETLTTDLQFAPVTDGVELDVNGVICKVTVSK